MKNVVNCGGILSHGIPDFRLDSTIVEKTIKKILDLGIEVEYNKTLGRDFTLESLKKEYDAIFISIGSNIPMKMNIENEGIQGVYGANKLLEENIHPDYKDKKVAVIGGRKCSNGLCKNNKEKRGKGSIYNIQKSRRTNASRNKRNRRSKGRRNYIPISK